MEKTYGELSYCESLIMKIVWENMEGISMQDLMNQLDCRFEKKYARTTVVTFVGKLVKKEFVTTFRKGKSSYIQAIKDEQEFKRRLFEEQIGFWYDGKPSKLVAALCEGEELSTEEIKKIKELIDDEEL